MVPKPQLFSSAGLGADAVYCMWTDIRVTTRLVKKCFLMSSLNLP